MPYVVLNEEPKTGHGVRPMSTYLMGNPAGWLWWCHFCDGHASVHDSGGVRGHSGCGRCVCPSLGMQEEQALWTAALAAGWDGRGKRFDKTNQAS